jgi:hypothetical protein
MIIIKRGDPYVATNGQGLALWRYSVIRQPGTLYTKDKIVDYYRKHQRTSRAEIKTEQRTGR